MRVPFSEKSFYLDEFRGRTLLFAVRGPLLEDARWLSPVLADLARHDTRVVLLSESEARLVAAAGAPALAVTPDLEGSTWRQLRQRPLLGIAVPAGPGFEAACADVALRLRITKCVLVESAGGLRGPDGRPLSFVHMDELRGLLRDARVLPEARLPLLEQIERLVEAGVPAVNVCAPEGLADELFTYAGSGTLVTAERYVDVRQLGIDDYAAAADLLARGVEEGFLAPRSDAEVDGILAAGLGAFVEGRHLAGIAALRTLEEGQGEIVALYTLTRFVGEGIGGHLVGAAVARARLQGLHAVWACTTSDRVGGFFERQAFEAVPQDALPPARWQGYDPERRGRLRCYRRAV